MKESGGFCTRLVGRKESMETSIWPRRGNFTGNVLAGNFYLTKNGLKFKKIHRGLMNPKDSTSFANFALQQCCIETYP